VNLKLNRWTGSNFQHSFGGKPIVSYDGKAMFAELAIVQIVQRAGWSSRWVETYGSNNKEPVFLIDWLDAPLTEQISQPLDSAFHQERLAKIAAQNGNSYNGCWDVLAWSGERTLFIETKQYKKDTIRDSQIKWSLAGLKTGLEPTNFLIAQWDFN
jgi:hypothetical protein